MKSDELAKIDPEYAAEAAEWRARRTEKTEDWRANMSVAAEQYAEANNLPPEQTADMLRRSTA